MSSTGPAHQIAWLPGESLEVTLDSRKGAVTSEADGRSLLTITSHRVIRVGVEAGKRTTGMTPLDRVSAVEVTDVGRPVERLAQGLIVLGVGALLGWVSWVVLGVPLVSLILGGLPILASVYILAGFAFPDEDGELTIYAGAHLIRHPLLSAVARRDAYAVAQRICELIAPAAETPGPEPRPLSPTELRAAGHPDVVQETVAGLPVRFPITMEAAAGELDSLMGLSAGTAERSAGEVPGLAERVRQSIGVVANSDYYVTRQVLRDPAHDEFGEGDFIWAMVFVRPDAHRVYQTAWSGGAAVSDQWLAVGGDFYRILGGAWAKRADTVHFTGEVRLGRRLQADVYAGLLLEGARGAAQVYSYRNRTYLCIEHHSIPRHLLAQLIDNPSPPQALQWQARIWLDLETNHLAKVEITLEHTHTNTRLHLDQAFAAFHPAQSNE